MHVQIQFPSHLYENLLAHVDETNILKYIPFQKNIFKNNYKTHFLRVCGIVIILSKRHSNFLIILLISLLRELLQLVRLLLVLQTLLLFLKIHHIALHKLFQLCKAKVHLYLKKMHITNFFYLF
jgi:hypothetical protein